MIRMISSTVLVYEFFAAGGFPSRDIPDGLAAEALGMLWALLADFKRWGRVRTLTAIDSRLENRIGGLNRTTLPADEVVCLQRDEHRDIYGSLLSRCDAVLLIAPETYGVLAALAAQAEEAGVPLLGSSTSAITITANKASCHRVFRAAKLPTPATRCTPFPSALKTAERMKYPLVIKPVDGMGSEGVCRVGSPSDLKACLKAFRQVTSHNKILLQSLVSGTPVSVSLLACQGRSMPLSLNLQLIGTGPNLRYLGSQVPFRHPEGWRAVDLACSAVSRITGLSGYVGVDLILTDDSAQLIEINPRPTTSYIGLRQVSGINVAQGIWDACIRGILPEQVSLTGQVLVKKEDVGSWGMDGNLE
jgi:predicted ATP-grasp superfamily ATP-dependent carboligase